MRFYTSLWGVHIIVVYILEFIMLEIKSQNIYIHTHRQHTWVLYPHRRNLEWQFHAKISWLFTTTSAFLRGLFSQFQADNWNRTAYPKKILNWDIQNLYTFLNTEALMTWNPKVLHLPCYSYELPLIIAKKKTMVIIKQMMESLLFCCYNSCAN